MIAALLIPRCLRRAEANSRKIYGGPPFMREPHPAPSLWEANRANRESQEHRMRAAVVRARKAVG